MDGGSIDRDDSAARFPASLAQTRFWLLDALDPGSPALNVAVRWTLLGPLTPEKAELAWRRVITRHEVLRTALLPVDGAPVQTVYSSLPFHLQHHDLSMLPEAERLPEADRLGRAEARIPFALETAPLMRACLITFSPGIAQMLLTLHHAVCDGWSIGVLASEFTTAFADLVLPDLPLQYGDYAEWQQAWLVSPAVATAKTYWTRQLASLPYVVVPPDYASSERGSGAIASCLLPRSVTEEITRLARHHGCTLFTVALAALGRMLQARIGTNDIVVGTQIANRNEVELEPMVGCFINTLVLRLDLSQAPTWDDLVTHAATVVADALQYGELPFEMLIQSLNPKRERGRTPLFSVNLIFQRSFVAPPQHAGLTLVDMPSHSAGALYDLNFFMVERPDGWRASCEYDTARYLPATVEAMLTEWITAFQGKPIPALCSQTEARVAELWCDVLGVEAPARDDNFFEVGGHSLLAARLLSRIEAAFAHRVAMAELFAEPTLGGLARRLDSIATSADSVEVLNAAGAGTPVVAFGEAARWRAISLALGPRVPFACLASPTVDRLTRLHASGKCALLASGTDSIAALDLAETLRQQGREVMLVLVEAVAPQRPGLLSRFRRPTISKRFDGRTLLFCQPGRREQSGDWADHLAGDVNVIELPSSPWEAAVAHHIATALA